MEKKSTGKTVIIVILLLAVIGLGGYIVYDKVFSLEKTKEESTKEETNEDNVMLSGDLALALGKKLYENARNVAYNICALGSISVSDTCYYFNNGKMEQDSTCQKGEVPYYLVVNTNYKNDFSNNGLKQYENYMQTQNAGKFAISNNAYYIRDGLGDCQQGWSEKSFKIAVDNILNDKITFNVTERYCDLGHFDECEAGNMKYAKDINTTFTIVKENNDWKIEDYTDSYDKYLNEVNEIN